MELKTCMNEACRVTMSSDWKNGWELKSGRFATLCVSCGIAYDTSTFCNIFHKSEDGWRKCRKCGKRVHCGCSASKMHLEILDIGGVTCKNCINIIDTNVNTVYASPSSISQVNVAKVASTSDVVSSVESGIKCKCLSEILPPPPRWAATQTRTGLGCSGSQKLLQTQKSGTQKMNDEGMNVHFVKPAAIIHNSTSQTQHLRYMPRTTRQELQQISENLKSAVIPLFEKILSASDVGKMDRIVLPKSCAEEYFPPVYESEGLPIKIQDVKGKEWTFLLRFWLNNSSRMYVLEGVTSFLKTMELQAGDAVTFSRKHPSGKLVIGFRKITSCPGISNVETQCGSLIETSNVGANDNDICHRVMKKVSRDSKEMLLPPPSIMNIDNDPPAMGKTAIFTMKPSGSSSSWVPNEISPTGQATLIEGSRGYEREIIECTKSIEVDPSGLDILATTALLAENMENVADTGVGETHKKSRLSPS